VDEGYGRYVEVRTWSRRDYMIQMVMLDGVGWFTASEAVSSVAIEHPEWDMAEARTWEEWQELLGNGRNKK
jgi:hypothetical protein